MAFAFSLAPRKRQMLFEGLDTIALTVRMQPWTRVFEDQ